MSDKKQTIKFYISFIAKYSPLICILFILSLSVFKYFQIKAAIAEGATKGPPPDAVTTTEVKLRDWHTIIRTVGDIEPVEGAVLSAEVSGRISKLHIDDGQLVEKGDLLIEFDSRVEESEYNAAIAQSELLRKSFNRLKKLYKANAISAEEFDTAKLNYQASVANAESLKAKLDKLEIKAPFSGTVGVRRINEGSYVNQGDPLIPLQNTSKLYLSFSLSQDELNNVKTGDLVYAYFNKNKKIKASIVAIDPSISPDTKTFTLKAEFKDDVSELRPGMFVTTEVHFSDERKVLTIPSTSIQYAPFGDSVYIIEKSEDNSGNKTTIVNPAFIKIVDRRGDIAAIEKGLKKGDQIVSSGTFKLRPGAQVIINNSVTPSEKLNPKPENS